MPSEFLIFYHFQGHITFFCGSNISSLLLVFKCCSKGLVNTINGAKLFHRKWAELLNLPPSKYFGVACNKLLSSAELLCVLNEIQQIAESIHQIQFISWSCRAKHPPPKLGPFSWGWVGVGTPGGSIFKVWAPFGRGSCALEAREAFNLIRLNSETLFYNAQARGLIFVGGLQNGIRTLILSEKIPKKVKEKSSTHRKQEGYKLDK